jgi:hypothetical protein
LYNGLETHSHKNCIFNVIRSKKGSN